jgi:hypothetical protein
LVDFPVEGGAADSEEGCGFGDVAAGASKRFADETAFPDFKIEGFHFGAASIAEAEIVEIDFFAFGQNHGAINYVT